MSFNNYTKIFVFILILSGLIFLGVKLLGKQTKDNYIMEKKISDDRIHVAFLILATSNKRDNWKSMKDTYLYQLTLKTALQTIDNEHNYTFYVGVDENDRILDNWKEQQIVKNMMDKFDNINIEFVRIKNCQKGHVTKMWNQVCKKAYEDGVQYFYQCGDDINFTTKGWVNDSINILKKHNNYGITGPINNNNRILTQAMVSRKHVDIFGWFFPEEIKNITCDDWYNYVYQPNLFFPLKEHYAENIGGNQRYSWEYNKVNQLVMYAKNLAEHDKKKIYKHIKENH